MQNIACDADDTLDQGLPFGDGNGAGGDEDLGRPGFMPIAPLDERSVAAGGTPGSAAGFSLPQ